MMNAAETAALIASCRAKVHSVCQVVAGAGTTRAKALEIFVSDIPVTLTTRKSRRAGVFAPTKIDLSQDHTLNIGTIRINSRLCDTPEKFRSTLLHEFAHALVYWMGYHESHGRVWSRYMRLLGQEPRRCHNYDVAQAFPGYVEKLRSRWHDGICATGTHEFQVGPQRAAKIRKGSATYLCVACKNAGVRSIVKLK